MSTVHNCRIERRTRLKTRTRLERKTPLRPISPERRARRRAKGDVYGPYYVRIANLDTCVFQRGRQDHTCVHYSDRRPEAHHLDSVGSGGKDAGNLVDVCHAGHDLFHSGKTEAELADEHELDFRREALRLQEAHG